ncbi:hypothetical protein PGT21_016384 [Puccinia graminis f. sp. tritici]|uniref:dihydroneopterin aldolase n=1 Tax=Puccinia graminis f. sp. tritici TaxID=56615 RepID=A0A5B0N8H4_PUCGR|nr:hypothetical protein PGT21_016384 [Puccinia graminis f. sp. tritici]KAA1093307.1 hypothetical protein PGTUg99_016838 [Puccinia graminis f. sp. tritici]
MVNPLQATDHPSTINMSPASLTPFGPVERDSVIIRSLSVIPRIGDEKSSEQEHQPALLHLRVIPWDGFSGSIKHDRLCSDTLSYFDLSKRIISRLSHELPFPSVHHLLDELQLSILRDIEEQQALNGARLIDASPHPPRVDYELTIEFPSLISLANRLSLSRSTTFPDLTRIQIDEIKTYSIIGILPHERTQKQTMLISLVLWNRQSSPLDIQSLTRSVYQKVIESEFHTVEALADSISKHVLNFQGSHPPSTPKSIERVTVTVEKPEAVSCAAGVGVQITRSSNSQ